MRREYFQSTSLKSVALLTLVVIHVTGASAATEKVLHSFDSLRHGAGPSSTLVADAAGNLYGTTSGGGAYGTVFKLAPTSGGKWVQTVLHDFVGGPYGGADGAYPAGVTFDAAGNLYGTAGSGGTYGCGIVFELSPSKDGRWKETILHNFACYPIDGAGPIATLIFDQAGNLYGTTSGGGTGGGCGDQYYPASCGTVFELSPVSGGEWTESVVYNFQGGTDGCYPAASLTLDKSGNLYGTTEYSEGGGYNCFLGTGTVFELTPRSGGTWTKNLLYTFSGGSDGANPTAGLIFDSAGSLYGTTTQGGASGLGDVFELTPNSSGWTESVLYTFTGGSDGSYPYGTLSFDSTGRLDGTTTYGGTDGKGTIFQLSPGSQGWAETVLYSFTGGPDGSYPQAGLLTDSAGNFYTSADYGGDPGCNQGCGAVVEVPSSGGSATVLYDFPFVEDGSIPRGGLISDGSGSLYGTTTLGGSEQCYSSTCQGAVFELTPARDGKWKSTVLHAFSGKNGDGGDPVASLVFDNKGNLYGTTAQGGTSSCDQGGCGTVFELSPSAGGGWTESVIYTFLGGNDGAKPMGNLIFDKSGHLYGTTSGTGYGAGIVFELVPANGTWTKTVVYNFGGQYIGPGLVMDESGNLYGMMSYARGMPYGGVYKLSRNGGAGWTQTVLYAFSGQDGNAYSPGYLVSDKEGSLYGTLGGGLYNAGVVFKLSHNSEASWTETVLHNFIGVNGDGAAPYGPLIFDETGNLYGTTWIGGTNGGACNGVGCGTVFELSPSSDGTWKEHILHRFTGGRDGGQPQAGLLLDSAGELYGTSGQGGSGDQGTVFEIKQ